MTGLRILLVVLALALLLKSTAKQFSTAPMMGHTDSHWRYFWRLVSAHSQTFTEMIGVDREFENTKNEPNNNKHDLFDHDEEFESPVICQIGGKNPDALCFGTQLACDHRYAGINLNCGCPSHTVALDNAMGAAMMLDAEWTAYCCARMNEVASKHNISVSVKCRVGVNDIDDYNSLANFILKLNENGGVNQFYVHTRKALLGISTISNRDVPPLRYDLLHKLIDDFPHVVFHGNGGIDSVEGALGHLGECPGMAGVMVGRACVNHPYQFIDIDRTFYNQSRAPLQTRGDILDQYIRYCKRVEAVSVSPAHTGVGVETMTKQRLHQRTLALVAAPFNLFEGEEGADAFRRRAKAMAFRVTKASSILQAAATEIPAHTLDSTSFKTMRELKVFELARRGSGPLRRLIV